MRKLMLFFSFSLIAIAGSVSAAQISLDEDYMQTMEDRQKSLAKNIGVQNAQGANEDVKELEDMFGEVQDYYEHKVNQQDAIDWSKDSKDLSLTIEKYVAANDYDNATIAATTLAKTCKACHRVYKKEKEKK